MFLFQPPQYLSTEPLEPVVGAGVAVGDEVTAVACDFYVAGDVVHFFQDVGRAAWNGFEIHTTVTAKHAAAQIGDACAEYLAEFVFRLAHSGFKLW